MEWSPQQATALKRVEAWLRGTGRQQVFRLFGYAGTGKTTLAKYAAAMVAGRTLYACYTGKAALVLRRKGCAGAQTLHSLIYTPVEGAGGDVQFVLNKDSPIRSADLLIVDEVSMVGAELGSDLLSFGVRVLVLGDPGQLPPISGQGFFMDGQPDVLLTEVHRQAADNPIIRLSMEVRDDQPLMTGVYGDSRIIRRMDLKAEDVLAADQLIVGKNNTRKAMNRWVRRKRGCEDPMPVAGDKVICLKNRREIGLLNGGMWTVEQAVARQQWMVLRIRSEDDPGMLDPIQVDVLRNFFDYTEADIDRFMRKESEEFTYGYAITCHKSQGSEWPSVMLFDESHAFREHSARWLYTAVTRAADRITIVL